MIRPPIVGAETWRKVMSAASYQCQCSGTCSKKHATRCERRAVPGAPPLVVAPSEVPMSAFEAARLPVEDLRAWCPSCYAAALAVARRQVKATPPQSEALFDGGEVA